MDISFRSQSYVSGPIYEFRNTFKNIDERKLLVDYKNATQDFIIEYEDKVIKLLNKYMNILTDREKEILKEKDSYLYNNAIKNNENNKYEYKINQNILILKDMNILNLIVMKK